MDSIHSIGIPILLIVYNIIDSRITSKKAYIKLNGLLIVLIEY